MNLAADCLALTGLDGTHIGIGIAIAIGAIVAGIAIFERRWRNRAVLTLAPLLILAGIGGLALATPTPAHAVTSCESTSLAPVSSEAPIPTPTGAPPILQPIVFGDYNGASPYVPTYVGYDPYYLILDPATIYLPVCYREPAATWLTTFDQQITALGDGTITYSSTDLTSPDAITSDGLVSFERTTYGRTDGRDTHSFTVTATNDFGSDTKTYTFVSPGCA